jgi:hypothetical protein
MHAAGRAEVAGADSPRPPQRTTVSALTATAWVPHVELDLRMWLEHGRRFGALGRSVGWWIGDWLTYGNARYGERYSRAARTTGYDPQSLMNMAYVASRFTVERRREALSWSHHAEVAALSHAEQERWLDLAERERMSVRSLRTELQAARRIEGRGDVRAAAQLPPVATTANVICPHCRRVIELRGD